MLKGEFPQKSDRVFDSALSEKRFLASRELLFPTTFAERKATLNRFQTEPHFSDVPKST
ncbi:hypothetical protein RMSM_00638 [Rhodopirellula maiorica SM1]|uniref:Uncharacterized protein n=1 Tax=Rhodopirellula maiorica SM1 TaxID=1265738 RepID=M5RSW6_9BACT|nr:hypothetical protein RMSM_00638 [Rhodopirellula maiorica SM1]